MFLRPLKWHRNGWNSLLLATKEHVGHISALLLLIDSKPIYRFVMHHNSMKCKLRNQGMDLCKQYNAQHSPTIVISSSLFLVLAVNDVEEVLLTA